jgi:hypothetical protein
MPHCYLIAIRDNTRIYAFHRAALFQPPLGGKVDQWHDKIMIFNGDVCGSQMPQPAVCMPPQLLQVTTATQKVYSWQTYLLHYTKGAAANPVAPVLNNVPVGQYKEVFTRKAMYVPPSLVHIFLARSVTIGRANLAAHHALTANEAKIPVLYAPLLNWLCVLATEGGKASLERASPPSSVLLNWQQNLAPLARRASRTLFKP